MPTDDSIAKAMERLGLSPPPEFMFEPTADLNDLLQRRPMTNRHVCGPDCGNGTHVFEMTVTPGVLMLPDPSPSPDHMRFLELITRLAWGASTPVEDSALVRPMNENQPPA